jgi:hypothetical protein
MEHGASAFECHWSLVIRHLGSCALCVALLLVTACSSPTSPDDPAVRAALERYFATWSARDMEGYAACFHPQARIHFVTSDRGVDSEGLTDFLFSQRMAHQQAKSPLKEVPKSMKITVGKGIAQAHVRWELQKGEGNTTGSDFFTLAKTSEGWRITALVWEQD